MPILGPKRIKLARDPHLICRHRSELSEVFPEVLQALLEELVDGLTLFHLHGPSMARAVPVRVSDLNLLLFQPQLLFFPLLKQAKKHNIDR